jgi:hypothetical protein
MRAKLNGREDTEGMSESIFHPRRVLAVLVVMTILLAAVAAFLSSTGENTKYSPSTPEGVVQLYLTAVIEGKNDKAVNYLSASSECTASDLDRSWKPESVRVNLGSTDFDGDTVYVDTLVDISSGGPFDDYYTEKHSFRLVKESGNWRIQGIPWPMYSCGEMNK